MGKSNSSGIVNSKRTRTLKDGNEKSSSGPVIYWCDRDQRCNDNWALLYAAEQASSKGVALAVVFTLEHARLAQGARQAGFMLRGLRELDATLAKHGIPFVLLEGSAADSLSEFVSACSASLLVTDMTPLREGIQARQAVAARLAEELPFHEVDAHNIVPVWLASDKKEVGARTLRSRLHRNFGEFLVDFPPMPTVTKWTDASCLPPPLDWNKLIDRAITAGKEVPEVSWVVPGEEGANLTLQHFLHARLSLYQARNDPNRPQGLSGLSPYLHFGMISAQRCILEANKVRSKDAKAVDDFVEECAVRRELADNFCFYEPNYDKLEGQTYAWATESLASHAKDKRPHLYSREQLEKGSTADHLWNAAQQEVVFGGKMHGFMRMYWAKKILEWTPSPQVALETALYLNDKYQLDGSDPNGFVGCMWSIVGVHDQGWKEREVFGKIRYMNYDGCKRKFSIDGYVQRVRRLVNAVKKGDSSSDVNPGGFQLPKTLPAEWPSLKKSGAAPQSSMPKKSAPNKVAPKPQSPLTPKCSPETLQRLVKVAVEAAAKIKEGGEVQETRAVDALKSVLRENVSAEIVIKAQVGKQVKLLCKHENKAIAKNSKDIVTHWQKIVMAQSA
eukprot:CAMPEP_0196582598 /NCGR_PEP_ID=MMETSP1081-20130531/39648_1 /TAXON_ID=36882 /ORGANISM="Pyramimonas amylifera, Strain CCMP720" /LENGTH=616 /DNA_ID=CAMNT_0041903211 /DNA_START=359 /DNA_END=2209 /DNA_ORIENTATION=+